MEKDGFTMFLLQKMSNAREFKVERSDFIVEKWTALT